MPVTVSKARSIDSSAPTTINTSSVNQDVKPARPLDTISVTDNLITYSVRRRRQLTENSLRRMNKDIKKIPNVDVKNLDGVQDMMRHNLLNGSKYITYVDNASSDSVTKTLKAFTARKNPRIQAGNTIHEERPLVTDAMLATAGQTMLADLTKTLLTNVTYQGHSFTMSPLRLVQYQNGYGPLMGVALLMCYFLQLSQPDNPDLISSIAVLDKNGRIKILPEDDKKARALMSELKTFQIEFSQQFPFKLSKHSEPDIAALMKKFEDKIYKKLGIKPLCAIGKTFTLDEKKIDNKDTQLIHQITDVKIGVSTKDLKIDESFKKQNKDEKTVDEITKEKMQEVNFRREFNLPEKTHKNKSKKPLLTIFKVFMMIAKIIKLYIERNKLPQAHRQFIDITNNSVPTIPYNGNPYQHREMQKSHQPQTQNSLASENSHSLPKNDLFSNDPITKQALHWKKIQERRARHAKKQASISPDIVFETATPPRKA